MKENLLKIINYYGVMPQLKYFQSEVFELNEAIIKFENHDFGEFKKNKNMFTKDIIEEIADVMVMLEQFRIYYGIDIGEVGGVMNKKIKRQLERINNEKVMEDKW